MRRREGSIEELGRLQLLEGGRPVSRRAGETRGAGSGGRSAAPHKRDVSLRMRRRRRLARTILAALAIGLVVLVLFSPVMRYVESRHAHTSTEAELEKEKAETAELEARRERAKTEEFIEAEARGMGYVKPGEIPIIVIDEKKEEGEAQDSVEPPAP